MAKSKKSAEVRKLAPDLELSIKLRQGIDQTFSALEATLTSATERNPELARRLTVPLRQHKEAIMLLCFGDGPLLAEAKRKRR